MIQRKHELEGSTYKFYSNIWSISNIASYKNAVELFGYIQIYNIPIISLCLSLESSLRVR